MASPQALTLYTPVLAVTNTTGATWAGNYLKLSEPNLTLADVKAIQAISLINYLFTAKDYRTNHGGLIADAMNFTRGISMLNYDVATALNDWNAADTASVGLNTDIAALLLTGKDLRQLPIETLNRIVVFLRAQIGV